MPHTGSVTIAIGCLLLDRRAGPIPLIAGTWKLNIIPLSACSAMWQCAIHSPGFDTSSTMSTVSPVRTSTVSFHTRFGSLDPVAATMHQEPAGPVDVERVVHRVIGVHLVHEPDLHPVADRERPVDLGVACARVAIDQRSTACWSGSVIRLISSHRVFPLDAALGVARRGRRSDASVRRGPSAARALERGGHERDRKQLHAAHRAPGRLDAHDLRIHRAGEAAAHRAAPRRPAVRGHVHLGDEREDLVRLAIEVGRARRARSTSSSGLARSVVERRRPTRSPVRR